MQLLEKKLWRSLSRLRSNIVVYLRRHESMVMTLFWYILVPAFLLTFQTWSCAFPCVIQMRSYSPWCWLWTFAGDVVATRLYWVLCHTLGHTFGPYHVCAVRLGQHPFRLKTHATYWYGDAWSWTWREELLVLLSFVLTIPHDASVSVGSTLP